jgi:hypothetical protein
VANKQITSIKKEGKQAYSSTVLAVKLIINMLKCNFECMYAPTLLSLCLTAPGGGGGGGGGVVARGMVELGVLSWLSQGNYKYSSWRRGSFSRGNFTCRDCLFAPCTEQQLCPSEFSWSVSINHYQSATEGYN